MPVRSATRHDTATSRTAASTAGPVAALACRALVKRYGDIVAVDGLDLEVRAGECFGLLGPNGAGKTTTVELFEGLLQPDGGVLEVLGERWQGDSQRLRSRLGVQLQETRFPEKLRVAELAELFRSFYRDGLSPDGALALVGLEDKRRAFVRELSGGQKQRLSLACALVGDPEVLFLDEPTTGLDPASRRQIWEIVEGLKERGRTVLLTTHYMEEAARLCDRVAIIDRGKILAEGAPAALVASLGAEHVIELETDAELPAEPQLLVLAGGAGIDQRASEIERPGVVQERDVDPPDKAWTAVVDWSARLRRGGGTPAWLARQVVDDIRPRADPTRRVALGQQLLVGRDDGSA